MHSSFFDKVPPYNAAYISQTYDAGTNTTRYYNNRATNFYSVLRGIKDTNVERLSKNIHTEKLVPVTDEDIAAHVVKYFNDTTDMTAEDSQRCMLSHKGRSLIVVQKETNGTAYRIPYETRRDDEESTRRHIAFVLNYTYAVISSLNLSSFIQELFYIIENGTRYYRYGTLHEETRKISTSELFEIARKVSRNAEQSSSIRNLNKSLSASCELNMRFFDPNMQQFQTGTSIRILSNPDPDPETAIIIQLTRMTNLTTVIHKRIAQKLGPDSGTVRLPQDPDAVRFTRDSRPAVNTRVTPKTEVRDSSNESTTQVNPIIRNMTLANAADAFGWFLDE